MKHLSGSFDRTFVVQKGMKNGAWCLDYLCQTLKLIKDKRVGESILPSSKYFKNLVPMATRWSEIFDWIR